jgi:hypothetical protein
MKLKNISRRCKSRVKPVPLEDLDRILGELAWAKERGFLFQELEDHVTSAVMRRDLGK